MLEGLQKRNMGSAHALSERKLEISYSFSIFDPNSNLETLIERIKANRRPSRADPLPIPLNPQILKPFHPRPKLFHKVLNTDLVEKIFRIKVDLFKINFNFFHPGEDFPFFLRVISDVAFDFV